MKSTQEKNCGNQTALHHKTTTFRCDHMYDDTSTRAAYLHHPAWVEVSHGWVPVNTHSTPVPGLPGRLWVARYTDTTGRPRHDLRRAQQFHGTLKSRMVAEPWLLHGQQEPDPPPEVVPAPRGMSAPVSRRERVCRVPRGAP